MQKYGIDAETAMNRENNKAAYEQLLASLASNERIQEGVNEVNRYTVDRNLEGILDTNRTNLSATQDTNKTNLGIAGINKDAQLGVAGINRDTQLGVAGINANTALTTAELQNQLNKYLGELGYNQAIAGYQNAYDIANLNNLSAKELQELANKNAYDIASLNNQSALALQKLQNTQAAQAAQNENEYMDYNTAAINVHDILTSGSPQELNGVTSWESLKQYLANVTGDWDKSSKYVEDLKKNEPGLIETYLTNLRAAKAAQNSANARRGGAGGKLME
jgi:hypothetical protein